jgi:hypothetical protein
MDNTVLYLYYFGMEDSKLFIGETVESKRILYTPSLFAKENLFYLQETGSLQARKPHVKNDPIWTPICFSSCRAGPEPYNRKTGRIS